jgi:hypothetical protein
MLSILPSVLVLGLAALAAFLMTSTRASAPDKLTERSAAARALTLATVAQAIHFGEELATGLHRRLGDPFGLPDIPISAFVAFYLAWLSFWIWSIPGLRRSSAAAFFAAWFLAIAGVLNGLLHPVLATATGGYFPGLVTAIPVGLACAWLWLRLREATGPARLPTV